MDIEYRPATAGDLELLMAWRSHPKLYENFLEQDGELKWENHVEWWESRANRRDWIILVRTESRWRDVGVVALSELTDATPEVNIWIGETTLWGNGVGCDALKFALDWLRHRDFDGASARILKTNDPSQNLFESVGFETVSEKDDLLEYQITF